MVLLALGIYLRTMLPSTGFWDTGEAQTVPPTLSIFHPTGFPTYAMLGWLWSQLPIGEVAWRMNLLSAVCVALGRRLRRADRRPPHRRAGSARCAAAAAGIAGAAFAFASEPWENATRADVHAINVLFVGVVLWLLLTLAGGRARPARRAPAAGWWAPRWRSGSGSASHPAHRAASPSASAPGSSSSTAGLWRRWRLIGLCAAVVRASASRSFGYIWLRAISDPEPPLFYARPDTWERFRYLVFAEQFSGLFRDFRAAAGRPRRQVGGRASACSRPSSSAPGWLLVAVGAAVVAAAQSLGNVRRAAPVRGRQRRRTP